MIPLIFKNRMFYESTGRITGHTITDQLITLNMPQPQYEDEVTFCDVVDEGEDLS